MDTIQQNHINALAEARKKDQKMQQPGISHNSADIAQNQKGMQSGTFNTQRNHGNALAEARKKDQKRQQSGGSGNGERSEYEITKDSAAKVDKIATEVASGREVKAAVDTVKLGVHLRKAAGNDSKMPWIIALVAAIIAEIFSETWIIKVLIDIFLFVFLWRRGKFKGRIVYRILMFIDFIPLVDLIPWNVFAVIYCWRNTHKKYKKKQQNQNS